MIRNLILTTGKTIDSIKFYRRKSHGLVFTDCEICIGNHAVTTTAIKSVEDNDNKAIGCKIALSRALRYLYNREERAEIWEKIFEISPKMKQ